MGDKGKVWWAFRASHRTGSIAQPDPGAGTCALTEKGGVRRIMADQHVRRREDWPFGQCQIHHMADAQRYGFVVYWTRAEGGILFYQQRVL
jgi:hypothetical protein